MVRILLLIASGIITIIFWTPLVVYGEVVHHSTLYTALGISGTIIFETTILFLLFIRDVHFIPPDKNRTYNDWQMEEDTRRIRVAVEKEARRND